MALPLDFGDCVIFTFGGMNINFAELMLIVMFINWSHYFKSLFKGDEKAFICLWLEDTYSA